MSDVGLYSSDIQRLRTLGELVDTVLVGATVERSEEFRNACRELADALTSATKKPASSLRSLYLSELLHGHLDSAFASWESVIRDLSLCSLGSEARQRLESLARLLEVERARTANRIQSMR
jgi:hypothetical protein